MLFLRKKQRERKTGDINFSVHQALSAHKALEVEVLLSHILGKPREFLYLNPEHKLTNKQFNSLTKLIEQRKKGEPVAYILGYKHFCGLKFRVNKNVLIPRPETEWLVNLAVTIIKKYYRRFRKNPNLYLTSKFLHWSKDSHPDTASRGNDKIKILDMGTGSGCIAVSIAKLLTHYQLTNLQFYASDTSIHALTIAKQNSKAHSAEINFIHSDLFQNIKGKFDIIVSNLPYVPVDRYKILKSNLQYEPKDALTDNTNVWTIYQKFFPQLHKYLKPHGTALLEIDEESKTALSQMTKQILPNWRANFHKDTAGLWRYLELRR